MMSAAICATALWCFVVDSTFSLVAWDTQSASSPGTWEKAWRCGDWPGRQPGAKPWMMELEEFSPRALEFAYMVDNSLGSKQNSGKEPSQTPDENSFDPAPREHQLQEDPRGDELDESAVALLDTACTSCIHSRRWRLSYAKDLPAEHECSVTPGKKHFHFANRDSTAEKLSVWRIPIFLGGRLGEVYSAEVLSGHTTAVVDFNNESWIWF